MADKQTPAADPAAATTNPSNDADAFRAAFLSEIGDDTATAADTADADASDDPGDGADASDDPGDDPDADTDDSTEDAATATPFDAKLLATAISVGDPALLIQALGEEAADKLLGAKGHKALRQAAKEVTKSRTGLVKAAADLKTQFGEPAAIRAAAAKGDHDTVLDGLERFFGVPATALMKFIHEGLAGRPAKLEAKAQAEQATKAATDTTRAAAETRVRESITTLVKKTDATLLEAHPTIVQLVFDKMRTDFKRGCDTPTKALAAVKADLKKQHDALQKVFGGKKRAPEVRPPREPSGKRGRELTPDEFRAQFLAENAREERAARKRGAV